MKKSTYTEHESPPSKCPHCGNLNDRAGNPWGNGGPQEGDLSVCIKCAGWCVFDSNLLLQVPTAEQIAEMSIETRQRLNKITNAIKLIKP